MDKWAKCARKFAKKGKFDMKILKRSLAALSAAAVAAGVCGSVSASATSAKEMTMADIIKDMGVGINLGNTFESCGVETGVGSWTYKAAFETGWGSPKVTQAMIQGMADEGFGSVRIPVAWSNTFKKGDTTYTIDQDALDRVKEVAQWAVDADLYVIVNIHWDGGWWAKAFGTDKDEAMKRYTRMWEQIADEFKDFDQHLIFESLNEEGGSWEEYVSKDESYKMLNEVNQTFTDLVRNSGGNNADRPLLIAGYNTDIAKTCDERFEMPKDDKNLSAVSVHYYSPQPFALVTDPVSWCPTPRKDWGTEEDYIDLNNSMDTLKKRFVDNGVPVIMGECGMGSEIISKNEGDATKLILAEIEAMRTRGIAPVLWDINYTESNKQGNIIYNRNTCKLTDPDIKAGIAALSDLDLKKDTVISGDTEAELTYKGDSKKLTLTADSGAEVKYLSGNEDVVTVAADGTITPVAVGTTVIKVYTKATDEYLPGYTEVTVKVVAAENPPVVPDSKMTVDNSVKNTSQIKLPEGWKWLKNVALAEGETTTAKAIYSDKNYKNRTVEVEIYRQKVGETDSSSDSDTSSTEDTSSNSSSASSSSSSGSSSASSGSSSSTSSAASSSGSSAVNNDKNAATGIGGGIAGFAILGAAVMVVAKKKGE